MSARNGGGPERLATGPRAMAAATLAARITADRPDLPRRPGNLIAYGVREACARAYDVDLASVSRAALLQHDPEATDLAARVRAGTLGLRRAVHLLRERQGRAQSPAQLYGRRSADRARVMEAHAREQLELAQRAWVAARDALLAELRREAVAP